jgi:hypothetical protein
VVSIASIASQSSITGEANAMGKTCLMTIEKSWNVKGVIIE